MSKGSLGKSGPGNTRPFPIGILGVWERWRHVLGASGRQDGSSDNKSDVDDPAERPPITILKTEFEAAALSEFRRHTRQAKAISDAREPRYVHLSSPFF